MWMGNSVQRMDAVCASTRNLPIGAPGIRIGTEACMSTTPASATSSVDSLVRQLVEKIDQDRNGQISTAEFGTFLEGLLKTRELLTDPTKRASAAGSGTLDGSDTIGGGEEIHPSQWTDNNAPYGVTLAGFSPQNQTHLTPEDLGIPGKAEKYAVYSYLLNNRIQPTSDWAPAAADALNKKYSTNVFHAIDGETLGYGNEYVHSAPNGYGLLAGQYNPNATGEFFWGWV